MACNSNYVWRVGSSSVVSFTQFFPTCGRMPLPALSLWPGRRPCRPRLVDDRSGGGPSSVAPRSRNPPLVKIEEQYSSDNTRAHGEGISSEDRCQQTHRCQNCVTGVYCIERQLRCYHDWNSGECP